VLLAEHVPSIFSVVGRWTNIRIEGTQLLADPEWDTEDPEALKIKGKVDRGFVRGVSLGLLPTGDPAWVLAVDGVPDLASSEAMEASIVAIPSNKNAIKLYASEGMEMSEEAFQLSIDTIANKLNINMNKLTLSVACLMVLGLNSTENLVDVAASVEKLAVDNVANKKLVKELQEKLSKIENEKAVRLVDEAINAKKLDAGQRDALLKLAQSDFEAAKTLIEQLSERNTLAGNVNNKNNSTEVKTVEDFMKLSTDEQLLFKNDNPEEYQKLFV
jgi:hypothetical protein